MPAKFERNGVQLVQGRWLVYWAILDVEGNVAQLYKDPAKAAVEAVRQGGRAVEMRLSRIDWPKMKTED